MNKNFKFKKNDYVCVSADKYNVFNGLIDAYKVANNENLMYKVCGKWYYEEYLRKAHKPSMTPTEEQMAEIKRAYPILKRDNVKIIFEHGRNIFGLIYNKGGQQGKLRYSHGEFSVMSDKEARHYGYVL